ncbi:MAG: hypothetical protein R3C03_00030, partial [Pirellulaceae bacterium]
MTRDDSTAIFAPDASNPATERENIDTGDEADLPIISFAAIAPGAQSIGITAESVPASEVIAESAPASSDIGPQIQQANFLDRTKPIIEELVDGFSAGYVINNGKLEPTESAGMLVTVWGFQDSAGTPEIVVSKFDLTSSAQHLTSIATSLKLDELFLNSDGSRKFQLFPSSYGSFVMIEQIEGGCGGDSVIDCGKSLARVSRCNGIQSSDSASFELRTHSRSPAIAIFDAVIDHRSPLVALISRPIPTPQIQLFDFSSSHSEPVLLSVPEADYITNDLETHFVGENSDIVCRFAKNAICIWNRSSLVFNTESNNVSLEILANGDENVGIEEIDWNVAGVIDVHKPELKVQPSLKQFRLTAKATPNTAQTTQADTIWVSTTEGGRIVYLSETPNRTIEIVDAITAQTVSSFAVDPAFSSIQDIRFSHDGNFVAIGGMKTTQQSDRSQAQSDEAELK